MTQPVRAAGDRRGACNALILLSDEQGADLLGCAGHPYARTPHLDALAARGTRFTAALTWREVVALYLVRVQSAPLPGTNTATGV